MDPRHAVLFEPVVIGPKTLPNRFYQVPHASGFGVRKPRTHAAFRGIKAEGGWGGVNVDYAPVSSDADETPAVASDAWEQADLDALGLVVEAVHAHGALAGIELHHGGAASPNGESRHHRIAPSQTGSAWLNSSAAKEMTTADIRRVQADFVLAARRARDVGFDIVYVYGAHGYLVTQFLSPLTNRRTDGYGGSLANRARFQRETLELVREAVGADCAVATRMSAHGGEGLVGIDIEEMLEVVTLLDPLVDLFDVNVGAWPEDSGTSRYYEEGSQRPWTSRVREATAKPIVGVGRYTNPDLMAAVIRTGTVDLIGAARPAIADPFLPTKIREGRLDEVRECTGSNVCIMREESFGHVGCLQNPTAGEEYRRGWHPERFEPPVDASRSILVVGGGPAGLESAMVLGRRGFDAVHLVEAEPELGGKLRWTRRLPTLGDWGRVVDHRVLGLDRLDNVEVITGRRLTAAEVLDYGADTVVVATGSTWVTDGSQPDRLEPIGGHESALTPEQVMAGLRPPEGVVVVYDTDGYYVAPGLAELLAGEGYVVHLVTPLSVVSPVSDESLEGDLLRQHLHGTGVRFHTGVTLEAVRVGEVVGVDVFGEAWRLPVDGAVLVTQQRSDDALYLELTSDPAALATAGIAAVYRVGDAVAPGMPSEAVFDGHRLARELDGPDPSVPLPYLRERPVV
ncbi:MAG TPA: NAD(P)-binding protein [Candidatus Limnocylindria bacterium]|nr:NAD(P)-binding protein [Candidatus Limnocylindria bacterium]